MKSRLVISVLILVVSGCTGTSSSGGPGDVAQDVSDVGLDGAADAADAIGDAGVDAGDIGASGSLVGPEGGVVGSADGMVTLTIPPGALQEPTEIHVEPIDDIGALDLGEAAPYANAAYRFEPDGLRFDRPATLEWTLPTVPEDGFPLPSILSQSTEMGTEWLALEGYTLGPEHVQIRAEMSHFSFAVVVDTALPTEFFEHEGGAIEYGAAVLVSYYSYPDFLVPAETHSWTFIVRHASQGTILTVRFSGEETEVAERTGENVGSVTVACGTDASAILELVGAGEAGAAALVEIELPVGACPAVPEPCCGLIPTPSCELPDGGACAPGCTMVPETFCEEHGGRVINRGAGSCDEVICDGACCLGSGYCQVLDTTICLGDLDGDGRPDNPGARFMHQSECAPFLCNPSMELTSIEPTAAGEGGRVTVTGTDFPPAAVDDQVLGMSVAGVELNAILTNPDDSTDTLFAIVEDRSPPGVGFSTGTFVVPAGASRLDAWDVHLTSGLRSDPIDRTSSLSLAMLAEDDCGDGVDNDGDGDVDCDDTECADHESCLPFEGVWFVQSSEFSDCSGQTRGAPWIFWPDGTFTAGTGDVPEVVQRADGSPDAVSQLVWLNEGTWTLDGTTVTIEGCANPYPDVPDESWDDAPRELYWQGTWDPVAGTLDGTGAAQPRWRGPTTRECFDNIGAYPRCGGGVLFDCCEPLLPLCSARRGNVETLRRAGSLCHTSECTGIDYGAPRDDPSTWAWATHAGDGWDTVGALGRACPYSYSLDEWCGDLFDNDSDGEVDEADCVNP